MTVLIYELEKTRVNDMVVRSDCKQTGCHLG